MNEILPTGLEALLQRPAFRVLGEPLRRQLLALWEPGTDAAAATMRMDWSALAQMGVKDGIDAKIMAVAKATCAEGETIHNMPFPVTPESVHAAILTADLLGQQWLAR